MEASYLILTSSFRKMKFQGYECSIRKSQVARYVLSCILFGGHSLLGWELRKRSAPPHHLLN